MRVQVPWSAERPGHLRLLCFDERGLRVQPVRRTSGAAQPLGMSDSGAGCPLDRNPQLRPEAREAGHRVADERIETRYGEGLEDPVERDVVTPLKNAPLATLDGIPRDACAATVMRSRAHPPPVKGAVWQIFLKVRKRLTL